MTDTADGLRFGKRRVPKMYAQVNKLRQAIAAEGSPRIQAAWDKVEEHIDFAYQQAGAGTAPTTGSGDGCNIGGDAKGA